MPKLNTATAFLDIGCTNVTDDLKSCFYHHQNGNQDAIMTINNYIELLNKAIGVLSILKDSVTPEESKNIQLFSDNDELGITADQEIIDRFVGFGIATLPEEWTDQSCSDSDSDSDSDSEADTETEMGYSTSESDD